MLYTTYELIIKSELILPELIPLNDNNIEEGVDVAITVSAVDNAGLANGKQLGPFLWVTPTQLWLQVPNVARFLVENGKQITIDPEPGIDEDSVRVFLLGSAFGALLFQRGYLVLHGNAIRIGDQCLICVGQSGAGKSTLAAGFMQRGYPVLADDVVPVDAECRALPGFPRIKLWQDVADKLEIDTSNLQRVRPNLEKFNYPIHSDEVNKPLPIRWIYILGTDHIDTMHTESIKGMERFQPLYNNTYRVRFLNGMALKPQHLQLCGQLASRIHLSRLIRPRVEFTLDEMIDTILDDIDKNP
jgi:hypothetical protein